MGTGPVLQNGYHALSVKRFLNTYALAVAMLAVIVFRLALGTGMPLDVHAGATYDDAWCVRAASFISSGQWLGPYDDTTLIKGPGFPIFLALAHVQTLGYGLVLTLLWIVSCLLFVLALRPLLRKRKAVFILFAALLFCPVSFSTETFQRVYRNSATASQALLVFAGYLGMYLRLKGLRSADPTRLSDHGSWRRVRSSWLLILPWSLLAALSLAWFWVSREDSVWIAPFVLVATVVMAVMVFRSFGRSGAASRAVACLLLLALPLIGTGATVGGIASANQSAYGISTVSEIGSSEFARAIRDLYAIQPANQPANQRVAVSHDTLQRAYAASPALASIKEEVESEFADFGDAIDNDPGDGEVNGGEFFWVIRRAARDAGYFENAGKAQGFFGQVADELEAAFEAGTLRQRATWPNAIMTPWRGEYAGRLLPALAGQFWQAVSYGDVSCEPYIAQGPEDGIRFFESQVNGVAYRAGVPYPAACSVGMGATWLYRALGPLLALSGAVCTVLIWVRWARARGKGRSLWRPYLGAASLAILSILLSVLVLETGLAYSRVSSFVPIAYYYYGSAAYPLLLAANLLALFGVLQSGPRSARSSADDSEGGND